MLILLVKQSGIINRSIDKAKPRNKTKNLFFYTKIFIYLYVLCVLINQN